MGLLKEYKAICYGCAPHGHCEVKITLSTSHGAEITGKDAPRACLFPDNEKFSYKSPYWRIIFRSKEEL